MGKSRYSIAQSKTRQDISVSGQFHDPGVITLKEITPLLLDTWLGVSERRSGHCSEYKNFLLLLIIKPDS
jgi:hypothetical protein